jgi:hypothetical protein
MESAFEGYLHCPKSSEINDAYLQMDTSHAATETFQTASHSHDWAEVCHVAQARVYVVSLRLREQITNRENPKVFLGSLTASEKRTRCCSTHRARHKTP